jgi:hypothetical protein
MPSHSPNAPRNTEQTMAFLRRESEHETQDWTSRCLSLQRQARGLPGVYPSALAAQQATPKGERVTKIADLRRGMVAFFDDPNDSNPYGHIVGVVGWRQGSRRGNLDDLLTWTNSSDDVIMARASLYPGSWGDAFRFGATWLNGYDFADFDKPPKPVRGKLGDNYRHAIADVERAIYEHRKLNHPVLVAALQQDLAYMRKRFKAWD